MLLLHHDHCSCTPESGTCRLLSHRRRGYTAHIDDTPAHNPDVYANKLQTQLIMPHTYINIQYTLLLLIMLITCWVYGTAVEYFSPQIFRAIGSRSCSRIRASAYIRVDVSDRWMCRFSDTRVVYFFHVFLEFV